MKRLIWIAVGLLIAVAVLALVRSARRPEAPVGILDPALIAAKPGDSPLLGIKTGDGPPLPPTPEAAVAAFTAACHGGDLAAARKLWQLGEATPPNERAFFHLCGILRHAHPVIAPQLFREDNAATVFLRYEADDPSATYPDAEAPPVTLSWAVARQGARGWSIRYAAGAGF